MTLTTTHFGVDIPVIGFGTWKLKGEDGHRATLEAINAGYRHIDTAQAYENETHVGRGIRDAQLPREDLFLTTKVWMDRFRDGDLQRSAEESLDRLGTDHVDLLLLHWHNPDVPLAETIEALNDARDKGLTRHIGVSNFTTALMDEAVSLSRAPILTNQVEYHPFINQTPVLEAARGFGMAVTGYSPLAQGEVFDDPVLQRLADRHGVSPAQIVLRWYVQQPGVVAIPRSSSAEHIRSNNDIHDFALSPAEMGEIDKLKARHRRLIDPDWAPDWDPG